MYQVLGGFEFDGHIAASARLQEAKVGRYVLGGHHAPSVGLRLNNFRIHQVQISSDLQDDLDSARVDKRAQDY